MNRSRSPLMRFGAAALFAGALAFSPPARAAEGNGLRLEVLVNGIPRPEYAARGTRYIEARVGAEYTLRITNTTGSRLAVALAVDGLNTIDAGHQSARNARKWVLDPWESAEIAGWQVADARARAFYFTRESQSYGAWLGQTSNLGNIEAVAFREKYYPPPAYPAPVTPPIYERDSRRDRSGYPMGSLGGRSNEEGELDGAARKDAPKAAAEAPAPSVGSLSGDYGGGPAREKQRSMADKKAQPTDDAYAATGIGRDMYHPVDTVNLELEERPMTTLRIRYEFHDTLVSLGVLPPPYPRPLPRRERGGGFSDSWAPEPPYGR